MSTVVTVRKRHLQVAEQPTFDTLTESFLARRDLADGTRRVYALTLRPLAERLGSTVLVDLEGLTLASAVLELWPDAAPRTWNRIVATVRSALAHAGRRGWLDDAQERTLSRALERRREPRDETKALTREEIDRLLKGRDVGLREKTLWSLLYASAARAQEVLSLDISDLDLDNNRATITGKGGHLEQLCWETHTARLLPRLIGERTAGPVFLSERAPDPRRRPAKADLCPDTGRARLSYRRSAELFAEHSGGKTLHQLRHSAMTHLAEGNLSLPNLMAISRHESLRSLQRYARPSFEAAAAAKAALDPAARRRR